MSLDFSKCHCLKPGFCKLYGKIMEENPPNWQWCQAATPEHRKIHYEQTKNRPELSDCTEYISPKYTIDFLPEQKNKFAICTIPANKQAKEQLDHTRNSILEYANKCNADYIELCGDINPSWSMSNKYRLYAVSSKYDKTLYLDCDVFILDNAPNIFDLTPDDKISAINELSIFRERGQLEWIQLQQQYILTRILDNNSENEPGKLMLNCGVMVIPKKLAEYYKQPIIEYPKFWCFDQHLLSLTLPKDKFNKLDIKWNLVHSSKRFVENLDSSYFIHLNDCSPDDKVNMLNYLRIHNLSSFKEKYKQKKVLPLVMVYNKKFEDLAFLSSSSILNKNIHVHLNEIDVITSNDGFNTKSWYRAITKKIEFSKQIFDTLSYNDCICISDADIFYINSNRVYELKKYLQGSTIEFVAPSESYIIKDKKSGVINAGFYIIKKTKNTKNFFDYILSHDLTTFKYADQDVINKYLNEYRINYEILDTDLFVMGCYMDSIGIQLNDIALLHTTCANNKEQKMKQINKIINRIGFHSIDWNNIKLTKKEITRYKNGN